MRKGRFFEEQMVGILREADLQPVAQVAKKHGISEQTILELGASVSTAMNADEVKRLRQLERRIPAWRSFWPSVTSKSR